MIVRSALLALSPFLALALACAPARAADAGPDAEARKLQVKHDQAIKAAETEVGNRQREIARYEKAIEDNDKRLVKIDKDTEKAKADLAEVEGAAQKLVDAKAAMDAADARVNKEFQQNHNPNTNSGGATDTAVKAQEDAQKEWQRLKRVAASAESEAPSHRQRVKSFESQRKSEERKKDDNLKKLEEAKSALEAAKQKLAEVQAAPVDKPADAPAKDAEPKDPAKNDAAKDPAKDEPAKDGEAKAPEAKQPEAKPSEVPKDAPAP